MSISVTSVRHLASSAGASDWLVSGSESLLVFRVVWWGGGGGEFGILGLAWWDEEVGRYDEEEGWFNCQSGENGWVAMRPFVPVLGMIACSDVDKARYRGIS